MTDEIRSAHFIDREGLDGDPANAGDDVGVGRPVLAGDID